MMDVARSIDREARRPDSYLLVPCERPPESTSDDIEDVITMLTDYMAGPAVDCYNRQRLLVEWVTLPDSRNPE